MEYANPNISLSAMRTIPEGELPEMTAMYVRCSLMAAIELLDEGGPIPSRGTIEATQNLLGSAMAKLSTMKIGFFWDERRAAPRTGRA